MAHGQPPLQSMWLTEDEGQTSFGRRFESFLHAGLKGGSVVRVQGSVGKSARGASGGRHYLGL